MRANRKSWAGIHVKCPTTLPTNGRVVLCFAVDCPQPTARSEIHGRPSFILTSVVPMDIYANMKNATHDLLSS